MLPLALAQNDPGHDTLYVVKSGDSNISGSINLTGTTTANDVRYARLLYGDLLDIRANGSIQSVTSRPAIQAGANNLYLDGNGNTLINTIGGTTSIVQIGDTVTQGITLNVSGTIRQQGITVCLSNGTNCPSTLGGANLTGSGTSGTLTKWTGSSTIGNSILSESGSTLTINGNISMPTTFWIGNGASVAGANGIAIGTNAVEKDSNGVAIGTSANSSGGQAVAIGNLARAAISSVAINGKADGSQSVAIGISTNASGANAIAIGTAAATAGITAISIGSSATATSTGSIAIGPSSSVTAINALALGSGANASHTDSVALGRTATTTAANQLMIGNVSTTLNTYIYGSLLANSSASTGSLVIANSTTTHLFINGTSGNVGIGTSNPSATVDVTSTTTTSGVRIVRNSNTTNISSDTPLLELVNTNVSTNQALSNNNYARLDFSAQNSSGTIFPMASIAGIFTNHTNETTGYSGQLALFTTSTGTTTERLRIDEQGNVGIGTSIPSEQLAVSGDGTWQLGLASVDTIARGASATDDGLITVDGELLFQIDDNSNQANSFRFYNGAEGEVATLNEAGDLQLDGTLLVNGTGTSAIAGNLTVSTTALHVDSTNKRVGAGTTTPARALHINDTLRLQPRSTAPSSPALGDLYADSDTNTLCFYNSTAWVSMNSVGTCA